MPSIYKYARFPQIEDVRGNENDWGLKLDSEVQGHMLVSTLLDTVQHFLALLNEFKRLLSSCLTVVVKVEI